MRIATLPAILLTALGAGFIALPDTGPPLFSLSTEHGPCTPDAAGVLLLLLGFGLLLRLILQARAPPSTTWGASPGGWRRSPSATGSAPACWWPESSATSGGSG